MSGLEIILRDSRQPPVTIASISREVKWNSPTEWKSQRVNLNWIYYELEQPKYTKITQVILCYTCDVIAMKKPRFIQLLFTKNERFGNVRSKDIIESLSYNDLTTVLC